MCLNHDAGVELCETSEASKKSCHKEETIVMKRVVLFFALVFLPSVLFAGIYGTLTGKVTDEEGKPVPRATVQLEGTSLGAIAGLDGTYRIVKIPAGTYTVVAKAVGYQPERKVVQISADEITELNFVLRQQAIQTGEVEVVASRMVDNTRVGAITNFTTADLAAVPRETVQSTVILTPGVLAAGTGFYVRGSRPTDTEFRVDGLDLSDQFTGGTGSIGLNDFPITSQFGTEEVQVIKGGFAAEYGSLAGVVNVTIKTGREDRYEGMLRYRMDVPALFGKAKNGLKAQGSGLRRMDLGVGGPLLSRDLLGLPVTFYLSGWHEYEQYRNNGLEVRDPAGNNLGQLPNNRRWVGNLTGRIKLGITQNMNLIFGGQYGRTLLETMSWGWLYANSPGLGYKTGGGYVQLNLPEYVAKRPVANQYVSQWLARLNHTVTQSSFYEVTVSWNYNRFEASKRKIYWDMEAQQWVIPDGALDPNFITGFELWEPRDVGFLTPEGALLSERDRILDQYYLYTAQVPTEDGLLVASRPVPNPLTGYIEGGEDVISTDNPYSLQGFFSEHGNTRTFDFRWSSYFQIDGYYYSLFKTGEFDHQLKAGFEARFFELNRHYNSLPWDGNPFFDVYTDEWGGNIYTDPTDTVTKRLTSQPFKPREGSIYVQDQIRYKGIIITPGLRLDVVDPNSVARSVLNPFIPIQYQQFDTAGWFKEASVKVQLSPRLYIAYPITDRSNFNVSYAMLFDRPPFNNFYDAFNTYRLRGNQIIGDPDIKPQTVKMYEIGYSNQLTDIFALDIRAYYKDMLNLTGLSYVPAVPTPYSLITVGEYGNARGLEIELRKQPTPSDHFGFRIGYTLSQAKGTASSTGSNYWLVIVGATDPYTGGMRVFPLEEYPLDYDRPHRIDAIVNFVWGENEGPSIGGIYLLENTLLNFTGFFQSGLPYTRLDRNGNQIGEYNGERQPDYWRVDMRLEKGFSLKGLLGDLVSDNARINFFIDVINLLNRTEPVTVYARTGNPDYDGTSLNRQIGDFSAVNYYRNGDPNISITFRADQYDRAGKRLYNPMADLNNDGITTQEERYQMYQRFVQDAIARQVNYDFPRTVYFGFYLNF